jgi:hypothetical protein
MSGYFGGMPENRLFNGIPRNGPFTGTINTARQIQFKVTNGTDQATFSFQGVMQADGYIAGTYCSLEVSTGKCSDYGLWSMAPVSHVVRARPLRAAYSTQSVAKPAINSSS